MIERMTDHAEEYLELKEKLQEKREQVKDKKDELFGSEASETEEKARDFFTEVSTDSSGDETKALDKLKEEEKNLDKKFDDAREDFLNSVSELKFPLEHRIDETGEDFVFPFKQDIDQAVIDALKSALNDDIDREDIEFDTDSLKVTASNTDEAMDKVSKWVKKIRKTARMKRDKNKYVSKLKNRDLKIQSMLFELYKSDEPLKKGELEQRIGVEKGELRGVLYQVLNNDPYLEKKNQQFSLTKTGEEVMQAYEDRYGEPDPISNGGEEE
jgi:hypothetical protein